MLLRSIRLINFRSYPDSSFAFEPEGAVIIGANGCGKTNLLEAIAYSGTGKSVRFHQDEQLVRHDNAFFTVAASYTSQEGLNNTISLSYCQNKKMLKVNNNPVRQLSYLIQTVKVTYLSPDDIVIINGSPRYRRQFFDLATSQIYPEYIAYYREYLHLLHQRNALLKREHSPAEKEHWDHQYTDSMAKILSYRDKYLTMMNKELAGKKGKLASIYGRELSIHPLPNAYHWMGPEPDPAILNKALNQIASREKAMQRSLLGAHLDDYAMQFDGKPLKFFGSQGQKRIAIFALKMAHAHLIEKNTGIQPVILFDDVLAELDDKNIHLVRDLFPCPYQTFIASPNEGVLKVWKDLPIVRLKKT